MRSYADSDTNPHADANSGQQRHTYADSDFNSDTHSHGDARR